MGPAQHRRRGADQGLAGVPGAALIVIAGYLLARQLQRWTDRTLRRLEFKRMMDAGGFSAAAERARMDPVLAVGKVVFWLMLLVVILLASSALGLENIKEMFGRMIEFIPTLISATIIIVLGLIVGEFVRGVIIASAGTVSGVPTLAKLAKSVMVLIAVFMDCSRWGWRRRSLPRPSP